MEHNAHRHYVHMVILVVATCAIIAALYSHNISFKPMAIGNVEPLANFGGVWSNDDKEKDRQKERKTTNKPEGGVEEDTWNQTSMRLPESITPFEYNLTLKVNIPGYAYKADDGKNMTFQGQIAIGFNVRKPTYSITLNSAQLEIHKIEMILVKNLKYERVNYSSFELNEEREELKIVMDEELQEGAVGYLRILYLAPLRNDMVGLYHTHYTQNGETRIAAVTKFEPFHARKMVPCFDEPIFKAIWNVKVAHPIGTVAISNEDEKSRNVNFDSGFIKTTFFPTPKMSSYLLAVFVSDFQQKSLSTKSGVKFRVWSRPEALEHVEYALEVGVKCLEFFEHYFETPYPMKKMDMAAIPDFASGAMENWGLITYRESLVLYNPKVYTGAHKSRVAEVIAHELAHQWFGNLVTMKWWNDLWLNEGFATFMANYGVDHASGGNFKQNDWELADSQNNALVSDSVASSHPLSVKIDRATEILDYFDAVTYDKGSSVIRMIETTMGAENFRAGISHFLEKYGHSNADVDDLFNALNEKMPNDVIGPDGGKLDISEFADPWLKQMAYPIIHASSLNSTHVELKQEKFRLSKNVEEKEKFQNPEWGYKWDVPIWYADDDLQKPRMVWLKRDESLILKTENVTVLNIDSNGFYRISYDDQLLMRIFGQLMSDHKVMSPRTIARTIDDAFVSASAGLINYRTASKICAYLIFEAEDHLPWAVSLSHIDKIADFYDKGEEKKIFDKYKLAMIGISKVQKTADFITVNLKNEKMFSQVSLAIQLFTVLTEANVEANTKGVMRAFNLTVAHCKNGEKTSECSKVFPPYRRLAYCQGVKEGGEVEFENVVGWLKAETDPVERENLQKALGCSTHIEKLMRLLLDTLQQPEESFIKPQDVPLLFATVAKNENVTGKQLLEFLIQNWDSISKIPTRGFIIRIITTLTSEVKNARLLQKLDEFIEKTPSTKNFDFDKIREGILVKIEWRRKYYKDVLEHFKRVNIELGPYYSRSQKGALFVF